MDRQLVLKNIKDLLVKLNKEELKGSHIKIVKQNLEILKSFISKTQTDNKNSIVWYNTCYWMNLMAAICIFVSDDKGDSVYEIEKISLAHAYIWACFVNGSMRSTEDGVLRDQLVVMTKLHFREVFTIVEMALREKYESLGPEEKYLQPQLKKVTRTWRTLKEKVSCEKELLGEMDEAMDKLVQIQKASVQDMVRLLTKKKNIPQEERLSQIQDWEFLMHLRNALTHRRGRPENDCERTFWGRKFVLKKDEQIKEYYEHYIILSIKLLELFLEINPQNISDEKIKHVKEQYFDEIHVSAVEYGNV